MDTVMGLGDEVVHQMEMVIPNMVLEGAAALLIIFMFHQTYSVSAAGATIALKIAL